MTSNYLIYCVGFLAQGFFSARLLIQWILSEHARRVISPTVFWLLSLAGSWLLCIYGWLRGDFAIVIGQFVSYYIYIWNLRLKGAMDNVPDVLNLFLILSPVAVVSMLLMDADAIARIFFRSDGVPLWLLLYGVCGQFLFILRFVYQWYISRRKGESLLPTGFWVLSLIGATLIVSYGFIRRDPVLILGHGVGIVAYARNLVLTRNT